MRSLKFLHIVGARPQFIKAAALRRAIASYAEAKIEDKLLHTGQHFDAAMSDVFFEELGIAKPDYHLNIGGGTHGAMTGRMLEEIEKVLLEEKPDWVVIYGDTNSTLAGALAAVKLHLPVAHVEAGLRSFNMQMPEEVNRVVADSCSQLLFTPTDTATHQLSSEGVAKDRIVQCGDIMYDVAMHHLDQALQRAELLEQLRVQPKEYVLATIHRAQNTDEPARLKAIVEQLDKLASDYPVVLPLHPRTRKALESNGLFEKLASRVKLIDPVGYLEMLLLEHHSCLIVTDSGGVQKEAFFLKVPCIVVRDETEWTELVDCGYHRLYDPLSQDLAAVSKQSLSQQYDWERNLYGLGNASQQITEALCGVGG